jgi:predicted TIM-barrel fold metal-dependent hydrolase
MRTGDDQPAVIVSSDTHIGPRLVDDLRPYCPQQHLEAFDDFAADISRQRAAVYAQAAGREQAAMTSNRTTAGHYDMAARLRDLDRDGVAAEIIFHGSQNEEPIPFGTFVAFLGPATDDPTLVAAGRRIYNRWLSDVVSMQPERHVGLAHLPMWDVEAAVAEVEWARRAGLRGINFPAPGPTLAPYNDPQWEPFWAACAAAELPLTTHSGAGDPAAWSGRESMVLMSIESGGWFSRRALHQMIFGGVFERHPRLQLVLTEQPGDWWRYTVRELDSAYVAHRKVLGDQVPQRPSEYCSTNVSIGASFLAAFEARDAVDHNYADQVLWGSDYPHMEGTWQNPVDDNEPSVTKLALRNTFAGIDGDDVLAMVGANAVRVYGLDPTALTAVAARIGAPTVTELTTPVDAIPERGSSFAFRTFGPWA